MSCCYFVLWFAVHSKTHVLVNILGTINILILISAGPNPPVRPPGGPMMGPGGPVVPMGGPPGPMGPGPMMPGKRTGDTSSASSSSSRGLWQYDILVLSSRLYINTLYRLN